MLSPTSASSTSPAPSRMPPITVRPAYSPPTHAQHDRVSLHASHCVRLRHPGYSDAHNVLLTLVAADCADGGIHHETARIACAVVAGNRWEGYLTREADGQPIDAAADDVLRDSDYYFHVPAAAAAPPYPIVPTFREWRFPRDGLPPSWLLAAAPPTPTRGVAVSNLSGALLLRDGSCRISACEEGCEAAHLVPRREDIWFHENAMSAYGAQFRRPVAAIDDARNALLLRADLHAAFDQLKFVFVPKPASSQLVVHLLDPLCLELRRLYHNVPLQPRLAVAPEFVFARFALALFPLVADFMQNGVARRLLVPSISADPVTLPAEKCRQLVAPEPRSRSASPKKRSRDAAAEQDAHDPERPRKRSASVNSPAQRKRRRVEAPGSSSSIASGSCPSPDSASNRSYSARSPATDLHMSPPRSDIVRLYQAYLEKERQRSDPDGLWRAEQAWLEAASRRPLGQSELRRYLEASGYDVLDPEDVSA